MKRRQVLLLLSAGALPLAASAQSSRIPRVGLLMLGNPDPGLFLREVIAGLRDLGYEEGRNIALERRNANGSPAQLDVVARELAALPVDVIVAFQTPVVAVAKNATKQIPIVMCPAQEPIELGSVQSFARPGGNITGMTTATAEVAAKNLDLIREVLPSVRRVGIVGNAADPFHKAFLAQIEAAARISNIDLKIALSQGAEPFPTVFAEVAGSGAEAMMIQPSLPSERAAELALHYRLPLFVPRIEAAQAGALMAYSADPAAVYRQAATFVDKIVKGRKPAELPVELATKFLLVVNLKTANALGLTLSPMLLGRADQVIE